MLAPKARANKTDINIKILKNISMKLAIIQYDTGFSVWLRTGSNPADIDRFRSKPY